MPNECFNTIKVKGDKAIIEQMLDFVKSDYQAFDFMKIIPDPMEMSDEERDQFEEKHGADYWKYTPGSFEWYHEYWGTNRNAWDSFVGYNKKGNDFEEFPTIEFMTAWSPSLRITIALSELFPALTFEHYYRELNMEINGYRIIKEGVIIEDSKCDIDNNEVYKFEDSENDGGFPRAESKGKRGIPRVRIHEDNFVEEIKNIIYTGVRNFDGIPEDYFIEVSNAKDDVIALFYHYRPFLRKNFRDVVEYAKYYDSIVHDQISNEVMILKGLWKKEEYKDWHAIDRHSRFHDAVNAIIAYGRLKYPLGLDDVFRKNYSYYADLPGVGDDLYDDLVMENEEFIDDVIDLLNFLLIASKEKKSDEEFNRTVLIYRYALIISGIEILRGIADNLFTRDNIDQFIEASSKNKIIPDWLGGGTIEIDIEKDPEIIAFLLDYKNKHFSVD